MVGRVSLVALVPQRDLARGVNLGTQAIERCAQEPIFGDVLRAPEPIHIPENPVEHIEANLLAPRPVETAHPEPGIEQERRARVCLAKRLGKVVHFFHRQSTAQPRVIVGVNLQGRRGPAVLTLDGRNRAHEVSIQAGQFAQKNIKPVVLVRHNVGVNHREVGRAPVALVECRAPQVVKCSGQER